MSKKRIILVFAVFMVVSLGAAFAQTSMSGYELRLCELINIERTKNNLPPFVLHNNLASVARLHSDDMCRNDFLQFTGSDGANASQMIKRNGITNVVSSNMFVTGTSNTPEQKVAEWMNSSSYRSIILNANYNHIGVGIVQRPAGSGARYANYWTILFIDNFPDMTPYEIRAFEMRVLELTNIERAKHNLPPLIWHDGLADVARAHSNDLMRNNMRGHVGSDGASASERVTRAGITDVRYGGENCDYHRRTPEAAVASWMNSPSHRDNILRSNITHLGVGLVQRTEDSGADWVTYWTQVFGVSR